MGQVSPFENSIALPFEATALADLQILQLNLVKELACLSPSLDFAFKEQLVLAFSSSFDTAEISGQDSSFGEEQVSGSTTDYLELSFGLVHP